jgi:hypothetical protein
VPSVDAVGDIDGNEVIGAKVFGKLHGITFIGLDAVTGFYGDERRCDDIATNPHLQEASRNPKFASARFVANVKVGELAVLFFDDASHRSFKGVLGSGNASVVAGFGITIRFEDCDDSFFFMDVESEVECMRCG